MTLSITIWVVCSLLFPPFAQEAVRRGPIPAGGGGGYSQVQTQGNDTDNNWIGDTNGHQYLASSFTASSTYGLRKVAVHFLKQGSPTFTITAKIYTDSGGSGPNTQTGADSNNTINSASLTGSFASYEFTWTADVNLTSSTRYWVVLVVSALGDGSNFVKWAGNPSGTEAQYASIAGSSWNLVQASMDGTITTYSFS